MDYNIDYTIKNIQIDFFVLINLEMLNINLIRVILTILGENGETRTLTLVKLINKYINNIRVQEPLVFEHLIDKDNNILLPFTGITVDWGDGQVNNALGRIYNTPGIYRVKIYHHSGNGTLITYESPAWADNITNFISIGRIGITNLNHMFYSSNFNGTIENNWDTTGVVDVSWMFFKANKFNQRVGDNWETSKITDMRGMFACASSFNQKIGDNWDTGNVKNMDAMFLGAYEFNQQIGDNWDTSNVIDVTSMFSENTNLRKKIGTNWDLANAIGKETMFYLIPESDYNNW